MKTGGFRGHVEDCVLDLNTRLESKFPKGEKGAAKARRPLADFCGVSVRTVTRWFHDTKLFPNGTELIKLMCYLELIGYTVIERERTQATCRNFGELIGFGLISIEQANELLGYSSTTSVYQILFGHIGASKDKYTKMWNEWKTRKDELESVKREAAERYNLNLSAEQPRKHEPEPPKQTAQPQTTVESKRWTVAVHLMECLTALLEDESLTRLEAVQLGSQSYTDAIDRLSSSLSIVRSGLTIQSQVKGDG